MKRSEIDGTADRITEAAVSGSAAKMVPAGSVLCVMRSGILKHTFPVAVSKVDVTLNQDMRALVMAEGADPRFVAHYLRKSSWDILAKCSKAGTTVNSIEAPRLDRYPVPLPPLGTQRRIVARIDELLAELVDGETALDRLGADLDTYRRSLLKAAVTGDLTADWRADNPAPEAGEKLLQRILSERRRSWEAEPRNRGRRYKEPPSADVARLPALPAGWTWASLAQVTFISGGLTVDQKRKPVDAVELPYLRVANVQRGHLDLAVVKTIAVDKHRVPDLLLRTGDVLLNEGGDRDKIGRGWVYEGQLDPCTHQNHVFRARAASGLVSPFLISIYLNELGRRFFIDEGKQTTNLASISLSNISRAPIAIPPAEEASVILEMIERRSMDDSLLSPVRDLSRPMRQSILAAAFRGELFQ